MELEAVASETVGGRDVEVGVGVGVGLGDGVGVGVGEGVDAGAESITLNEICRVVPGPVMTRMLAGVPKAIREKIVAKAPIGRIARPEEIAGVHAFLASEDAAYITGQVIFVDGGISVGV